MSTHSMRMNIETLPAGNDPMGTAIRDYHLFGRAARLRVLSSIFEEDEMPVGHLFRTFDEMPRLEQLAVKLAYGRTLDVGAGAGCHSIALQKRGVDVKAIDISPLSCKVMAERGVNDVECVNVFNRKLQGGFDTLLLLMNGTGVAGRLERLPLLLNRLKELMCDNGQILVDSSDLKYIYENEDGTCDIGQTTQYYGEVDYQMIYKDVKGKSFDWLYVDPELLATACGKCGLKCEIVEEGNHYDYLAKISKE